MRAKIKKRVSIKKKKVKSRSFFYSRGKGSILILLGIVILGSILLTGGLFPKQTFKETDINDEAMLVSQAPDPERDNLQLNTLKFKKCSETAAINFLLDRSGSMAFGGKINNLSNALLLFTNRLSDSSVLGVQSFGDPNNLQRIDIPISYYKEVKSTVPGVIRSLSPQGATYMRSAFEMARDELFRALDAKDTNGNKKFPDKYKFNLIFISDGVPETITCGRFTTPPLPQCSAEEQNPTKDPDIAQQIKDRGINIFTIAYLYSGDAEYDRQLEELMKKIATKDNTGTLYYYRAPINNQLDDILRQISTKLCSESN